jgi:phage gp36-like protein
MIFLVTNDFDTQIRADVLTKITDNEPTLLDEMELAAIEEIQSYLFRYDVAATFDTTGTARNRLLVMYCVDVMLYHLHSRVNPRQIPELRYVRYEAAKKWLESVSRGQIIANLPQKTDDNDGDGKSDSIATMKLTTFTKRKNNY